MNQKLIAFEKNERTLAARLFSHIPTIKGYTFSEGKLCWDAIITLDDDRKVLSEFKVRNFEADKYPDYILEVAKLVNLINKTKENGYDLLYYINFFENSNPALKDFIIFNLSERIKVWKVKPPQTIFKSMNKATFMSIYDKCEKEVIMLSYDEKIDCRGIITMN